MFFEFVSIDAEEEDYLFTDTSQIPNSGKGLFTAIDIFKDEVIAVFEGELLTDKQAAKRIKLGEDQYFIVLLNGKIMDSNHVECFAKFANDAKGKEGSLFKNNAKITLDENDIICIVATRKIKANEEVFCSYGSKYWKKHNG